MFDISNFSFGTFQSVFMVNFPYFYNCGPGLYKNFSESIGSPRLKYPKVGLPENANKKKSSSYSTCRTRVLRWLRNFSLGVECASAFEKVQNIPIFFLRLITILTFCKDCFFYIPIQEQHSSLCNFSYQ